MNFLQKTHQKNFILIGIILFTSLLLFLGLNRWGNQMNEIVKLNSPHLLAVKVEGNSMAPLIQPDTVVYYDPQAFLGSSRSVVNSQRGGIAIEEQGRNLPKKGDIILYEHSSNKNYLIKRVMATDADMIEFLSRDTTMRVGGELLHNSQGIVYVFTQQEINLLKLYIQNGKLPKGAYLIFGDNTTESYDSRKFGAVSLVDFRGKVVY